MASRLENAANVASVLMAAAALVFLVQRHERASEGPRLPPPPAEYDVGQDISKEVPIDFAGSNRTMIIAVQESCGYCEASMPFYQQIVAERDRLASDLRVVFIAPSRDADIKTYLASRGVKPDYVLSFDRDTTLKVRVTPTMLVADRSGHIVEARTGLVPPAQQPEFLDRLFRAGPSD